MKSKFYVGQVKHSQSNFTAAVLINDQPCQVHLNKFDNNTDFYILQFDKPCELKYLQEIKIRNKDKEITIIIPLLFTYNKRKLKKISSLFNIKNPVGEKKKIILKFLSIEHTIEVKSLLFFLDLTDDEAYGTLIGMAIKKEIKILEFNQMKIVLYSNYLILLEKFRKIVEEKFKSEQKTFFLKEINKKMEIDPQSIYFKYIFRKIQDKYSLKRTKDKIIFDQMVLSEDQKKLVNIINKVIKTQLPLIFTFDNITDLTKESYKKTNDALWYLVVEEERVIKLDNKYFISKDEYTKLINKLKKHKRNQSESITIQEFRELTNLNRKIIIIIFEAFDRRRITQRLGNERKILLEV